MQAYWLLKTEPDDYSWEDMLKDGSTVWDGVKSPAALKNLSRMQLGDMAIIYHTGRERSMVGLARVAGKPYPDPDKNQSHLLVVDLEPYDTLPRPVTLAQVKQSGLFPDWELVRQPRLSVVPVSQKQWKQVLKWAHYQ